MKTSPIKQARDCGWTTSRYFSFIRSALRRAWMKYPLKHKVLNSASRPYRGTDRRRKKEYQCNVCRGWFKGTDVSVDHIEPCGSLKTFEDLPKFVSTLFCEESNLQCICSACHSVKTKREREERK